MIFFSLFSLLFNECLGFGAFCTWWDYFDDFLVKCSFHIADLLW